MRSRAGAPTGNALSSQYDTSNNGMGGALGGVREERNSASASALLNFPRTLETARANMISAGGVPARDPREVCETLGIDSWENQVWL